jgi:hypothetical protein
MPPKMFTIIAFTLSSEVSILNASTTWIEILYNIYAASEAYVAVHRAYYNAIMIIKAQIKSQELLDISPMLKYICDVFRSRVECSSTISSLYLPL